MKWLLIALEGALYGAALATIVYFTLIYWNSNV